MIQPPKSQAKETIIPENDEESTIMLHVDDRHIQKAQNLITKLD